MPTLGSCSLILEPVADDADPPGAVHCAENVECVQFVITFFLAPTRMADSGELPPASVVFFRCAELEARAWFQFVEPDHHVQ